MAWHCDYSVPLIQQTRPSYDGAAAAAMILKSIGAPDFAQNKLYSDSHSHNRESRWNTDPEGMNWVLNQFKPSPPTFNSHFVIREKTTEVEQSQALVHTLYVYEVAAAVLAFQGGHWIVVRGVNTSADPSGTYSINGFYINDPWPMPPAAGSANTYVAYANWQSRYLQHPTNSADSWGGKFLGVHDPREGDLGDFVPADPGRKHDGQSLVHREQATWLAREGGREHGLHEHDDFGEALADGDHHDGLLVQSLDRRDAFYHLVPVEHGGGISATVMTDGLGGHLLGAQKYHEPLRELVISAEEARERVLYEEIDFGDQRGPIIVREDVLGQHPTLVWCPCRESRTPYHPFHMFHVGDDRVFVGHDGAVYPELHPLAVR